MDKKKKTLPEIPPEEKIAQEKASLKSIGDSFKKIVVVRDVVKPTQDEDGILTMGLFDFLLDPRSLDR